MEHLYVPYNSQLCLKNKHTQQYVGVQTKYVPNQIPNLRQSAVITLQATFLPACCQVQNPLQTDKTQRQNYTLRIKIINRDQQKQKEKEKYLIEGSKVHLINPFTEEYIICLNSGEIKFDRQSKISQDLNKHLLKASTWTIQLQRNLNKIIPTEKHYVTIYDEICFKSVHNTYLTIKGGNSQLWALTQVVPSKSIWNIMKANIPEIPQWVYTRSTFNKFTEYSNLSQVNSNNNIIRQKKLLKSFQPQLQQVLLIQDLLDVMLGFDGTYIKRHKTLNQYVIQPHLEQPSCNISLKQLVDKILYLPMLYSKVEGYIQTYSIQQGIVCQALCGGLRKLVKQYKNMIVQFDQQSKKGLTLQQLWYHVQAPIKVMESLNKLVEQAKKYRGGQLLTILTKSINQNNDPQIVQIYEFLFAYVLEVYVQMLSKWMYQGIVEDKFGQFMIMTQQKPQNKQWCYWQEKFLIREQMVPSIFAKFANQILVTGKYLNVLKTCNKLTEHPFKKQICLKFKKYFEMQSFSQPIIKAYEWANNQMMNLVFDHCRITEVLKSVKGYYFLQFGDLFVHLMDAAEQDFSMLKKKTSSEGYKGKLFSVQKMQNLFQLLIRTSSANNDPFKQQVSCKVSDITIYDQVHRIKTLQYKDKIQSQKPFVKKDSKYVDYFNLQYQFPFPLNLIFNKRSIAKYQVLFRFLFWCKFIERQLNNVWLSLQSTKQVRLPCYYSAYLLNQRMINFIKNFIYYLCYEVIQQNWLELNKALKKVKTFEDIIQCHQSFLNKCLTESLLTNSKLLIIITSQIGKVCQEFTRIRGIINKLHQQFSFQAIPTNQRTGSIISQRKMYIEQMKRQIQSQIDEDQSADFQALIKGHGQDFDNSMRKLLRQINILIGKQENYLVNLANRLDQEKYYNRRLKMKQFEPRQSQKGF